MRTLTIICALLACSLWSGCRALHPQDEEPIDHEMHEATVERLPPVEQAHAALAEQAPAQPASAAANPAPPVAGSTPASPVLDDDARTTIAALVASGALDRDAEKRLIDDLQKTDPALRGQVVQMLRTSLASRQAKQEVRQAVATEPVASAPPSPVTVPPLTAQRLPVTADSGKVELAGFNASQLTKIEPAPPVADKPRADTSASAEPTPAEPAATEPAPEVATKIDAPSDEPIGQSPAVDEPNSSDPPKKLSESMAWQEHVDAAAQQLANQLNNKPQSDDDVGQHAALRLLYLVGGKRDSALAAIEGVPPAQQDFWSKELYGLSSFLDAERNANPGRRAAEAAVHLRDATTRLGELANLSVRNMTFCSEVKSYGIYHKFDKYEFTPGQEVLLYAEVENFKSVHTPQGYHTALKSSCEILDSKGARVTEQEFPLTEEHCQNPRRDFFIRYFLTIPPRIYGGTYTLHLYLVDEHSHKMDQGSIEFTVKTKGG